ncbi:hypothetical protein OPV22_010288 [Ensete ventricosum]|uniref:Transcription factor MYB39 n=1 Tax=Ensete ventricosum TaxID=4639 RepID=A0AAV8RKI6_ENSVE|nr:hypothetical protein OPV22_010288 [Ensete ventricosum]
MGRSPCCDEIHVKKGPWAPEEDKKLVEYIQLHGHRRSWRELPKNAGLNRCGKSCRLRWTNYLRPDIKRGKLSEEEEGLIVQLHSALGNKWSKISTHLPGRTDNEIKNYWNTHLRKKLLRVGIDPVTHQRTTDLDLLSRLPNLLAATAKLGNLDNALRLHADAVARYQMLKGLITLMTPSVLPPNTDAMNRLGLLASPGRYDLLQQNDQLEGLVNGSLAFGQDQMLPTTPGLLGLVNPNTPSSSHASPVSRIPHEMMMMMMMKSSYDGSSTLTDSNSGITTPGFSSLDMPAAHSTPSSVSVSPENEAADFVQGACGTNASTPSQGWQGLNLGEPDEDFSWKDILDQTSWWEES